MRYRLQQLYSTYKWPQKAERELKNNALKKSKVCLSPADSKSPQEGRQGLLPLRQTGGLMLMRNTSFRSQEI